MVVDNTTMDALDWLRKHLESADVDLLREMVQTFVEAARRELESAGVEFSGPIERVGGMT